MCIHRWNHPDGPIMTSGDQAGHSIKSARLMFNMVVSYIILMLNDHTFIYSPSLCHPSRGFEKTVNDVWNV